MTHLSACIAVLITIMATAYGQVVIKWQVNKYGVLPEQFSDKIIAVAYLLINPWILSGLAAALLASIAWIAAMTKLDLAYAYPFTALTIVIVCILGVLFFQEPISNCRIIGVCLILLGLLFIGSNGK